MSKCKGYNDPNETDICVHCGNSLVGSEESSKSEKPELPDLAKSGWYEDPEGSGGPRWYDAKTKQWSEKVAAGTSQNLEFEEQDEKRTTSEPLESKIVGFPVLENWKTSVGMLVLGAICGFVFFMVLVLVVSGIQTSYRGPGPLYIPASRAGALAGPVAGIIAYTLTLLYAAFYSTLFSKKPRIRSSKLISFTNLFFGGVLFGCLWNWNLTKSHAEKKRLKGISWEVAIALSFFAIVIACFTYFTTDVPILERAKEQNATAIANGYSESTAGSTSGATHERNAR